MKRNNDGDVFNRLSEGSAFFRSQTSQRRNRKSRMSASKRVSCREKKEDQWQLSPDQTSMFAMDNRDQDTFEDEVRQADPWEKYQSQGKSQQDLTTLQINQSPLISVSQEDLQFKRYASVQRIENIQELRNIGPISMSGGPISISAEIEPEQSGSCVPPSPSRIPSPIEVVDPSNDPEEILITEIDLQDDPSLTHSKDENSQVPCISEKEDEASDEFDESPRSKSHFLNATLLSETLGQQKNEMDFIQTVQKINVNINDKDNEVIDLENEPEQFSKIELYGQQIQHYQDEETESKSDTSTPIRGIMTVDDVEKEEEPEPISHITKVSNPTEFQSSQFPFSESDEQQSNHLLNDKTPKLQIENDHLKRQIFLLTKKTQSLDHFEQLCTSQGRKLRQQELEIQCLQQELLQFKRDTCVLERTKAILEGEIKSFELAMENLQRALDENNQKIDEVSKSYREQKFENGQLYKTLESLEQELYESQSKHHDCLKQLRALKSMKRNSIDLACNVPKEIHNSPDNGREFYKQKKNQLLNSKIMEFSERIQNECQSQLVQRQFQSIEDKIEDIKQRQRRRNMIERPHSTFTKASNPMDYSPYQQQQQQQSQQQLCDQPLETPTWNSISTKEYPASASRQKKEFQPVLSSGRMALNQQLKKTDAMQKQMSRQNPMYSSRKSAIVLKKCERF